MLTTFPTTHHEVTTIEEKIDRETMVKIIAYAILAITSTFGNILVLYIFNKNRTLLTPFNLLIINLVISDILNGCVKDPLVIIGLRYQTWPFGRISCDFNGFAQGVCFDVTILTLATIAFYRYLSVVHGVRDRFTRQFILLTIFIIWILAIFDCLMPIFGWNRYRYTPLEYACLPDWTYESSYPTFIVVCFFAIPVLITVFSYISIYYTVKKILAKVLHEADTEQIRKLQQRVHQRELEVTKVMFRVFATFLVCFAPYSIVVFILVPADVQIGKEVLFAVGFLLNANSSINPIIYAFLYKRIREGYMKIIYKQVNCCQKLGQRIFLACICIALPFEPTSPENTRYSEHPV